MKAFANLAESVANAKITCPSTVDEITQKTLIKVCENWDKIESLSEAQRIPYVKQIARNEFYAWSRREVRQLNHLKKLAEYSPLTETGDPLSKLVAQEDLSRYKAWLSQRDSLDRKILELRQQGRHYREIAQELKLDKWQDARNRFDKLSKACPDEFRNFVTSMGSASDDVVRAVDVGTGALVRTEGAASFARPLSHAASRGCSVVDDVAKFGATGGKVVKAAAKGGRAALLLLLGGGGVIAAGAAAASGGKKSLKK